MQINPVVEYSKNNKMDVDLINELELSFKEYNHLKEILEEHIKKNNRCKAMALKFNTQELTDFWKEEINEDLLLLYKLNEMINDYKQNDKKHDIISCRNPKTFI